MKSEASGMVAVVDDEANIRETVGFALRKEGFRYQATLDFRDPDLRRILVLVGPATLGLAAVQINVLVNTSLATADKLSIAKSEGAGPLVDNLIITYLAGLKQVA